MGSYQVSTAKEKGLTYSLQSFQAFKEEQVEILGPTWVVDEVVWVEEQVEILGGLCQEKALHPVLQGVGPHILYMKQRMKLCSPLIEIGRFRVNKLEKNVLGI